MKSYFHVLHIQYYFRDVSLVDITLPLNIRASSHMDGGFKWRLSIPVMCE